MSEARQQDSAGNGRSREIAAAALAVGFTVKAAAKKANVGERTLFTWKRSPKFRARVARLREQLVSEAIGTLTKDMATAALALRKLLKSGNENTRLKAARSIIELAVRIREHAELADRVADLEAQLKGAAK